MSDVTPPRPCRLSIDSRGFIHVDGICLGRKVDGPNGPCLEIKDKNRHRAAQRGTDVVRVNLEDLSRAVRGQDGHTS